MAYNCSCADVSLQGTWNARWHHYSWSALRHFQCDGKYRVRNEQVECGALSACFTPLVTLVRFLYLASHVVRVRDRLSSLLQGFISEFSDLHLSQKPSLDYRPLFGRWAALLVHFGWGWRLEPERNGDNRAHRNQTLQIPIPRFAHFVHAFVFLLFNFIPFGTCCSAFLGPTISGLTENYLTFQWSTVVSTWKSLSPG